MYEKVVDGHHDVKWYFTMSSGYKGHDGQWQLDFNIWTIIKFLCMVMFDIHCCWCNRLLNWSFLLSALWHFGWSYSIADHIIFTNKKAPVGSSVLLPKMTPTLCAIVWNKIVYKLNIRHSKKQTVHYLSLELVNTDKFVKTQKFSWGTPTASVNRVCVLTERF